MKDIRIALVVTRSPVGALQDNLERTAAWCEIAKQKGAAIVCFPEMNISGYSVRDDIRRAAEPIPGPASIFVEQQAQRLNTVILAGLAEQNAEGPIFASHLVAGPTGMMGVYRKLHLAPAEQPVYAHGERIPLFEVAGVRFGIQLCYDAHFPELTTHMALKGADLIFMPHASPRRGSSQAKLTSWLRHLTARAFDNGLFVVACNQVGDNRNGLQFPGVAVAIDPMGNVMQEYAGPTEKILIVDLTAAELEGVRNHRMKYFLPNRRPELYEL